MSVSRCASVFASQESEEWCFTVDGQWTAVLVEARLKM